MRKAEIIESWSKKLIEGLNAKISKLLTIYAIEDYDELTKDQKKELDALIGELWACIEEWQR